MLTIKSGVFSLFVSSVVSVPFIVILSTIDCPSDTTNCRSRPVGLFAKLLHFSERGLILTLAVKLQSEVNITGIVVIILYLLLFV